jgi:hypothetical protein
MGLVKTLKGDDGKPYISLEDMIKELEELKNFRDDDVFDKKLVETILKTLTDMETQYYEKVLYRNDE